MKSSNGCVLLDHALELARVLTLDSVLAGRVEDPVLDRRELRNADDRARRAAGGARQRALEGLLWEQGQEFRAEDEGSRSQGSVFVLCR